MKRLALISLTIAATSLAFTGGAIAQPNSQITSVNARLDHALDTAHAMQGQVVTAKLTDSINTPAGKLAKGTDLIGHIDQIKAADSTSGAELTITFDKARLKNGQEMPIHATLLDLARYDSPDMMTVSVAGDATFLLEDRDGYGIKSNVAANDSGTITSKDKNIKLDSGTDLLVAIAPGASSANSGQ